LKLHKLDDIYLLLTNFIPRKFQTPGKSPFTVFLPRHMKCPRIAYNVYLYNCGGSKNKIPRNSHNFSSDWEGNA